MFDIISQIKEKDMLFLIKPVSQLQLHKMIDMYKQIDKIFHSFRMNNN